MKVKVLIIGLIAFIGIIGISMTENKKPKIDVPELVKNAFNKKYPSAKKVEWELEKEGEYEAEFKISKKEMSANFNEDGTWLVSETEMDEDDLPEPVKAAVANLFPDYELEEAELVERPNAPLAYEVELENEKDDSEVKAVFSADGVLIKQEVEADDDKEE